MANVLDSYKYAYMLYVHQRKTPTEIANETKLSVPTVYRALKKHGFIK